MINSQKEAEAARAERRILENELAMLGKDDPKRSSISHQLSETIADLRNWIVRTSVGLCFVPTCVNPGTETSIGKQWCLRHKP